MTKKPKGFSIVELMIAVFISIVVITGLITVFETTSIMNKTQNGLARIQENGRFAILHMKQNIEQAGFQYCMSSGDEGMETITGTVQRPWMVYTAAPAFPGVAVNPADFYFDTQNLIHGHECAAGCTPGFGSQGSDVSYPIPATGTGDGDRLARTDVLTFRYIAGSGLEVNSITASGANQMTIQLSDYSAALPAGNNPLPANSRVLVASCGNSPVYIADVVNSGGGTITVNVPVAADFATGGDGLTRVFDLDRDVRSITYYVANNIVDGRSIPTLYSVNNGTVNALVEGVDRFDVIYGVGMGVFPNKNLQYFTADQVQNLAPALCRPIPHDAPAGMVNGPGCGWRGVETIEIHLLLNTVQNSTTNADEQFIYSIDDLDLQSPTALGTGIPTYSMHRKEFFASIALKNSQK